MKSEKSVVMHSWCVQDNWNGIEIVSGEKARFFDKDGKSYIDMSSLSECNNLGHQHPKVVEAICEQAKKMCFVTSEWGSDIRRELAQKLLEICGFEGGRVFFTLGGADANENAIKFARFASGKYDGAVVAKKRSYHGASMSTINYSDDPRGSIHPKLEKVIRIPAPYYYRDGEGLDEKAFVEKIIKEAEQSILNTGVENVAAVLMEPHAGTNGIIPPKDFWPKLRKLCSKHNIYLIADEVMAGFGRTGKWFGWQHYENEKNENKPDMMTLAKGLTGAHLPLGAVVVNSEVNKKLSSQMLYTGLTYCGHPLSCAAGMAAVRAYEEENLIERSAQLGKYMFDMLKNIQAKYDIVGDVRGEGLFAILEFVKDKKSKQPICNWHETSSEIKSLILEAREQGVSFANRANILILSPPLVIPEKDLEMSMEVLDKLIYKLSNKLLAKEEKA